MNKRFPSTRLPACTPLLYNSFLQKETVTKTSRYFKTPAGVAGSAEVTFIEGVIGPVTSTGPRQLLRPDKLCEANEQGALAERPHEQPIKGKGEEESSGVGSIGGEVIEKRH